MLMQVAFFNQEFTGELVNNTYHSKFKVVNKAKVFTGPTESPCCRAR